MADKSVGELIAAQSVTPTDLFVLEQNGTAKKLTGQILENWLVSFADGHGGIQSISKLKTEGLADTYRITLADTTIFDFVVTNGRGVNRISKTSTSGLADTYTIEYNDGTTGKFIVTNGAKGDKGDNAYVWIKYASTEPTEASHSFGSLPDAWIGIYFGHLAEAPADWREYAWYQIKGEKGDTGAPATLVSSSATYQLGDSGSIIPSGAWSESVAVVPQGKYLWTRVVHQFNTGDPVTSYSVSRMGMDGAGSVSSVAGISPNADGNVPLKAEDVGALPSTGGDLTGELKMNGQPISGLNAPTENDQAANMGFVNQKVKKAAPLNLLDNSDFRNPVNQRGQTSYTSRGYCIDRWGTMSTNELFSINIADNGLELDNASDGVEFCYQLFSDEVSEYMKGKTFTIAVCQDDGTISTASGVCRAENVSSNTSMFDASSEDGKYYINIYKMSSTQLFSTRINVRAKQKCKFRWAAVYEGEYTAETLPEYQPKGYGAELAECQRYYQKFVTLEASGYLTSGSTAYNINIFLPVPMRIKPSIADTFRWLARTATGGYSLASGSSEIDATNMSLWSEQNADVSAVTLRDTLTASAGDTNNCILTYRIKNVVLSADL